MVMLRVVVEESRAVLQCFFVTNRRVACVLQAGEAPGAQGRNKNVATAGLSSCALRRGLRGEIFDEEVGGLLYSCSLI